VITKKPTGKIGDIMDEILEKLEQLGTKRITITFNVDTQEKLNEVMKILQESNWVLNKAEFEKYQYCMWVVEATKRFPMKEMKY
jgi:thiamine pyrophosphokinase